MRIAISGSHLVGKTTLAEALGDALPGHDVVPEPYYLLDDEGYAFADMPSIDDFERQLERSLQCLDESGPDVVFDRCPLDLLGYLLTHRDAAAFRLDEWLSRVRTSVATLDVIVFVPVEEPDRVAVPRAQRRLRAEVDAVLSDITLHDAYGIGIDAIAVQGPPDARLGQVIAHLGR